jgi:hypothetical protein
MVEVHLRPAFGECRSDRLTPGMVSDWVRKLADKIESGTLAGKSFNNLLNLFHVILEWARHPAQRYLAHDPLIGQKHVPKRKIERDFLEPAEIER